MSCLYLTIVEVGDHYMPKKLNTNRERSFTSWGGGGRQRGGGGYQKFLAPKAPEGGVIKKNERRRREGGGLQKISGAEGAKEGGLSKYCAEGTKGGPSKIYGAEGTKGGGVIRKRRRRRRPRGVWLKFTLMSRMCIVKIYFLYIFFDF